MNAHYENYIARSKATKKADAVQLILDHLLIGVRKGYSTELLCTKLNEKGIKPLVADKWRSNALQMQIMFLARMDETNSIVRAFKHMLEDDEATPADHALFQARTKH